MIEEKLVPEKIEDVEMKNLEAEKEPKPKSQHKIHKGPKE